MKRSSLRSHSLNFQLVKLLSISFVNASLLTILRSKHLYVTEGNSCCCVKSCEDAIGSAEEIDMRYVHEEADKRVPFFKYYFSEFWFFFHHLFPQKLTWNWQDRLLNSTALQDVTKYQHVSLARVKESTSRFNTAYQKAFALLVAMETVSEEIIGKIEKFTGQLYGIKRNSLQTKWRQQKLTMHGIKYFAPNIIRPRIEKLTYW